MTITSSDINNQSFSIDRKGYDVDEVDVFLEQLAQEVDEMNATIARLEGEYDGEDRFSGFDTPVGGASAEELAEKEAVIRDLQDQLAEKKANDNAIAQALIIAQRSADEIIENANNMAAQIHQDADDEAQRILDKANNEKQRIIEEIEKLESDREDSRSEYQGLLKDFIGDATKKLSDLGVTAPAGSAHARGSSNSRNQTSATRRSISAATYTTPQAPAAAVVAPATPRPSRVEKDLSGFGEADDAFEFGDID